MFEAFHPGATGVLYLVATGAEGYQALQSLHRASSAELKDPFLMAVRPTRASVADRLVATYLAPIADRSADRDTQGVPDAAIHDAANV